jgi:mono/diheme cytochrome c family protein
MPKPGSLSYVCLISLFSLVLCVTATAFLQEPTRTPEQPRAVPLIQSVAGPDLYRAYCASCHGREAKGNGPAAPALKADVPDLTTIAQRNGGVFPKHRVRQIISGDEIFISHGSREMPIWGPIFHQVEYDRDWGLVRLENLAKYLESIQQK